MATHSRHLSSGSKRKYHDFNTTKEEYQIERENINNDEKVNLSSGHSRTKSFRSSVVVDKKRFLDHGKSIDMDEGISGKGIFDFENDIYESTQDDEDDDNNA